MRNIYLCEPNCMVHKNGEYLTIRKNGHKISDISLNGVGNLLIFGNTQVTTQALTLLMDKKIDIIYLTASGKIRGRMFAETKRSIITRIAQYDCWFNEMKRLSIAKDIINRKILGQEDVIVRYEYRSQEKKLMGTRNELHSLAGRALKATSQQELMGIEGQAAAEYFSVFGSLLSEFDFAMRVRRPAFDPVNALLNLTYALLKNEIMVTAQTYSFDMQLGFLHTIRSGRDSFALDIIEIYRPILADRLVLTVLNKRRIISDDFISDENGTVLKPEALKKYCVIFQEHIYEGTYRGKIWKKVIEEDISDIKRKLFCKTL